MKQSTHAYTDTHTHTYTHTHTRMRTRVHTHTHTHTESSLRDSTTEKYVHINSISLNWKWFYGRTRNPISRLFPLPQMEMPADHSTSQRGKPQTAFSHGAEKTWVFCWSRTSQSLSRGPGNVERKSQDFCALCFSSEY